jgi:hypothetical protein
LSFVVDESSAETLHQAIRFNAPLLNGQETRYIAEALRNGHLQGDGPFTERCATLLERELGCGPSGPSLSAKEIEFLSEARVV